MAGKITNNVHENVKPIIRKVLFISRVWLGKIYIKHKDGNWEGIMADGHVLRAL